MLVELIHNTKVWVIVLRQSVPFLVWIQIVLSFSAGAFYALWRLIRFTLTPFLYPNDPKEIPYWVPFLGHGKAYFENSHALVAKGVEMCGHTKEPFALTIAGELFYVLPSSSDSDTFYNNITSLNWDEFLSKALVGFGVDKKRLNQLWTAPTTKSRLNPKAKNLINLTEDLYKRHLLPGATFDTLLARLEVGMESLLSPSAMKDRCNLSSPVSLLELCNILIDATQMSLFDPVLYKIDPGMTDDLQAFTDDLWKLLYYAPSVDSSRVKSLRERYIADFKRYIRLPKSSRGQETWLVTTLIDSYQAAGICEHDIAVMLVMVYWTGDANAYKLAFWMLSYMLHDPQLFASIKRETEPAVKFGKIDMQHLSNECPLLKSVYYESMRLTKRDIGIRKILADTEIGGKTLRKGNLAFVPCCQLHENEDVWGSNARSFDAKRFYHREHLATNPSYRPFGGGVNYCPGRFFAVPEIFSFIAVLIHRWDIKLSDGKLGGPQQFPVMDDNTITFGISRPMPESKVWVSLTQQDIM